MIQQYENEFEDNAIVDLIMKYNQISYNEIMKSELEFLSLYKEIAMQYPEQLNEI